MYDDDPEIDVFNPVPLYAPLRYTKETLKTLSLEMHELVDSLVWQTADFPTRRFLASLLDFPALENLCIRLSNLVEFHGPSSWDPVTPLVDLLPPSLRFLYIVDFNTEALPHWIDELSEVAKHRNTRFTVLKRLFIRPPGREGPNDDPRFRVRVYTGRERHVPPQINELEAALRPRVVALEERFRDVSVEFRLVCRYEVVEFP